MNRTALLLSTALCCSACAGGCGGRPAAPPDAAAIAPPPAPPKPAPAPAKTADEATLALPGDTTLVARLGEAGTPPPLRLSLRGPDGGVRDVGGWEAIGGPPPPHDLWPEAETWQVELTALDVTGPAVRLGLIATRGEDFYEAAEQVVLLRLPELSPLWRGDGDRRAEEMGRCARGHVVAFGGEGAGLRVAAKGYAEWHDSAEEENSQTPDFQALKKQCKAPPNHARVERLSP